ncbi:DUF6531 domain-containing protein [Nocardioides sp. CER19]|uniref:DUF6531 domain-containing protein n=1 Tax=Nocardioides sp. CER19 TaxID=3038538 RepID=UPI00244BE118|nr:DUF6531 domain-containing protein [Nocardioides sp. CER19]MDH2415273.1 RHS repeat-associated core domain-containing protein [Nocardioides sp. CER19]
MATASRYVGAYVPPGATASFTASGTVTTAAYFAGYRVAQYYLYLDASMSGSAVYSTSGIIDQYGYQLPLTIPFTKNFGSWKNTTGSDVPILLDLHAREAGLGGGGISWNVQVTITGAPEGACRLRNGIPLAQTYGGQCGCASGSTAYQHLTSRPVNTATGSLYESFTDLALPGAGKRLIFTRAYNSLDTTPGPLGAGWTFAFNASLSIDAGSGAVTVRAEDGKQAVYTLVNGVYHAPPGMLATLAAVSGGGYRLTKPDQSTLDFNASGQLTATKDRLGAGLTLSYSGGKLATITDAAGREVNLTFTGDQLTRLDLSDGRHIDYAYTDGMLTSVTDRRGKTTTYSYDANRRLTSALDPNGHYLFQNTYDPTTGRVVSQLDPRGKETTFGWDAATQTSTETDPRGNTWTYKYASNVLIKETNPLGQSTVYGYDGRLNRTRVTDGRGNITAMTYDAAGNMLTRTGPGPSSVRETWTYTPFNSVATYTNGRGKTTTYEYFPNQLLKKKTDPLGRETTYTWTPNGLPDTVTDPRGKTVDFDYDDAGNRTAMLSPEGNRTTYGYDAFGRQTSMVEARGNAAGANPDSFKTTWTYNANDQVSTITDPLGHETTNTYDDAGNLATVTDADGKVTNYEYDADNQVTTVTDPRGAETTTTYDDAGNVDSITTPAGTTSYTYDDANRVATEVTPRGNATGATPVDYTWTYTYDANRNRLTQSNPTAGTTTTTYDELNRPVTVTDAHNKATTTAYDADGNTVSVTDPLNNVTTYGYDDADQRTSMTDPAGKTTAYAYNRSGNQTAVTSPLGNTEKWTYNGDGLKATHIDPRGNVTGGTPSQYTTTYTYDPAGHLTSVADPLNHVVSYAYDPAGNLTSRTDARHNTTTYGYDAVNRLTTVTDPLDTTTTYTYDPTGNLASRTDANNHTTNYAYDLAGRLTEKTTRLGTWRYRYDPDGNLTSTETPAGVATATTDDSTIHRSYDPLNRLTSIDYSDDTPDVTYGYDELHQVSMTDHAVPGAASETYTYDAAGNLTDVSRGSNTFHYTYDANGRITSRTEPDGRTTAQTWDDDSRFTAVSDGSASTSFSYDAAGNRTESTYGDARESRGYDAAGNLNAIDQWSGTTRVAGQDITRDANDNPTQITRQYWSDGNHYSDGETYTYDADDRVTSGCWTRSPCTLSADSGITYTYDAVGNRLTETRSDGGTQTTTSYHYNAADQLTDTHQPATTSAPAVDKPYTYDANGNQTTAGANAYTYDLANRLTSATPDTGRPTTTYTYDGAGNRITAVTGTSSTGYTWDQNYPLPELVAETTGTATRSYLDDPNGDPVSITNPTADADADADAGTYFLHTNGTGSISSLTDPTGAVTATYDYEPFGGPRSTPIPAPSDLDNPVQFASEYLDASTGLYHLRARDYDPTTGRFTSLDPVAQDITDPYVSDYVYANNQPTVLTDPSGQCPMCVMALIGAATDLGIQVAINISNGCDPFHDINWSSVAASALLGAVGGEDVAQLLRFVRGARAAKAGTALRKVGDALESVDDVMANPSLLRGRHPALIENILKDTPGWKIEKLSRGSKAGRGWVFRQYTDTGNPTGLQLRWHPGGGHHGPDPYWRVIGPTGDLGGIIR